MTQRQRSVRAKARRQNAAAPKRIALGAALGAGAALAAPATAGAADFTVTTLADNAAPPVGSLREAINLANADPSSADRILFQAGLTGSITLVEDLPTLLGPTQIVGPGAAQLELNGDDQFRILAVDPNTAGDDVSVSGLTFFNGRGGRAYVASPGSGEPGFGGAIYNNDADLSITDSVFRSNRAAAYQTSNPSKYQANGGAVMSQSGSLTISGSRFVNNSLNGKYTSNGGAVFAESSSVTVTGSQFIGNRTYDGSGGALFAGTGNVNVSGSLFRANSAIEDGGGMTVGDGNLIVTNSEFISNSRRRRRRD